MTGPMRLTLAARASRIRAAQVAINGLSVDLRIEAQRRLRCSCAACVRAVVREVRALPAPVTIEVIAAPPGTVPCPGGVA